MAAKLAAPTPTVKRSPAHLKEKGLIDAYGAGRRIAYSAKWQTMHVRKRCDLFFSARMAQLSVIYAAFSHWAAPSSKSPAHYFFYRTVANKNNNMAIQTLYQQAIKFAAEHHGEQKVSGSNIPYVVHLSNVCMEILVAAGQTAGLNPELALQIALLHDVLEDTGTTETQLAEQFGAAVASGVKALTKNSALPQPERMCDSLQRIQQQPKEVWAVKLADRITNLQPPPAHWTKSKIRQYHEEAQIIYDELKDGNIYLANRLKEAIEKYKQYYR